MLKIPWQPYQASRGPNRTSALYYIQPRKLFRYPICQRYRLFFQNACGAQVKALGSKISNFRKISLAISSWPFALGWMASANQR